ncbi:MAG: microviridin/marinostatin family tricyclic proteinase inhibitor [Nostoc sp.]
MSSNTVKASNLQAVPFFARFLEEQPEDSDPPNIYTFKFPSDFEDR